MRNIHQKGIQKIPQFFLQSRKVSYIIDKLDKNAQFCEKVVIFSQFSNEHDEECRLNGPFFNQKIDTISMTKFNINIIKYIYKFEFISISESYNILKAAELKLFIIMLSLCTTEY